MLKQSVIAVVLSLLGAELLLQLTDYPPAPQMGWQWDRSPYALAEYKQEGIVNQLGLRGQPFDTDDDDLVVALVGDSYVETGVFPHDQMPEQLLQNILQTQYGIKNKVYSLASAGWGLDQELKALEQFFASGQRADVVVVWLTPVNDYWESTFVDRSVTSEPGPLKPTLVLDQQGESWFKPYYSQSKIVQLVQLAKDQQRYGRQSTVEQALRAQQLATLPTAARQQYATAEDCSARLASQDDMVQVAVEQDAIVVHTTELFSQGRSHFVPYAVDLSPLEHYQVQLHNHLLARMRDVARRHQAAFKIITPVGSDLDKTLNKIQCIVDDEGRYVPFDYQSGLRHLHNTDLKNDVLDAGLNSTEMTIISATDWHLNPQGNQLFLDSVASELNKAGLLNNKK